MRNNVTERKTTKRWMEWWMRWKWTETKYEEKMCVIKGEINQAKDIKSCKNIAVK